ncbi:TetR-like C-terminal domain-containing protein [Rhodocaloribacter sp.]
MEAFLELTSPRASFPEKASSTVEAISLHVRRVVKLLRGEVGRVAAEMIGEGQADPGFLEKFRREFFSQLLAPAREAIERAKASGELAESLDTDLALDLIYGPIYFRLLLGHNRLDEPFARALSEKVQSALTAS